MCRPFDADNEQFVHLFESTEAGVANMLKAVTSTGTGTSLI
jgi:hypothetical protein